MFGKKVISQNLIEQNDLVNKLYSFTFEFRPVKMQSPTSSRANCMRDKYLTTLGLIRLSCILSYTNQQQLTVRARLHEPGCRADLICRGDFYPELHGPDHARF